MIKTMASPVRGTFSACHTVVEIDWTPDGMEELRTDRGVIEAHYTERLVESAGVGIGRVFDNSEPVSVTIPYHAIQEIRTTKVEIENLDRDDIECDLIIWTRATRLENVAPEIPRHALENVMNSLSPRDGSMPNCDAGHLNQLARDLHQWVKPALGAGPGSLATKVVFSEPMEGVPANKSPELELGPFSQGVVIEDGRIQDVASGEQIAEIFQETMDDMASHMLGHPADGKWCIPRAGYHDDSEEFLNDTLKVYGRCFVQPYTKED